MSPEMFRGFFINQKQRGFQTVQTVTTYIVIENPGTYVRYDFYKKESNTIRDTDTHAHHCMGLLPLLQT